MEIAVLSTVAGLVVLGGIFHPMDARSSPIVK